MLHRASKLLASLLSAALLVPASGALVPALAQVVTAPVSVPVATPVAPIGAVLSGAGQIGRATPSATATLQGPGLSITPVAPALTARQASLANGSLALPAATAQSAELATAAQPKTGLATGISLISAKAELPKATVPAPARNASGKQSAVSSAVKAATPGQAGAAFDGTGVLPSQKQHHPELNLDPTPAAPEAPVSWNQVSVPSPRAIKGGLMNKVLGWVLGPGDAVVLPGNPKDEAGVEKALRDLIRSRPDLFSNLSQDSFRTILVKKVTGQAGLADTFYANFQQQKDTVRVEGSYLNFVVKMMGGKAVVVASTAELYPETSQVDTNGTLNDLQLRGKASERLGTPTNAVDDLRDLDRRIMYIGGQWRTVQVFFYQKLVVNVAVDVNSGETFAWDPRMQAAPNAAQQGLKAAPAGEAVGRGVADGPHQPGVELAVLPLAHIQIEEPSGTFYADKDGKFTVPGTGTDPVQLTVRLSGRFATVIDSDHKDLVVTLTAKPGEQLRAVFNPEGSEEGAVAQVNAYVHTTRVHDWIVSKGIDVAQLNKPMPINVNIDDECNAYYTPWNPSLNFFKSSGRCANSSYNDVNYHEYGHGVDDATGGGIKNGGLSEGWGDIIAMYMTGQPLLGRGFLKEGEHGWLRTGENTYQYNSHDEVHQQGEAWMGFGWTLRQSLIESLGDPGKGAALAEALVIPVFLAGVRDIPSAMQQVLLRDVGEDGKAAHQKQIVAAAKAHGINLKMPRAGQVEGLFASLANAAVTLAQAAVGQQTRQTVGTAGAKNI